MRREEADRARRLGVLVHSYAVQERLEGVVKTNGGEEREVLYRPWSEERRGRYYANEDNYILEVDVGGEDVSTREEFGRGERDDAAALSWDELGDWEELNNAIWDEVDPYQQRYQPVDSGYGTGA